MHFNSVVLVVPLLCLQLRTKIVILYIFLVSRRTFSNSEVFEIQNPKPSASIYYDCFVFDSQ